MSEEAQDHGVVAEVWEPEGYGYVRTRAGERVFFDRRRVRGNQFHDLFVGTEVRFVRDLGPKGWQADDLHVVRQDQRHLPLG